MLSLLYRTPTPAADPTADAEERQQVGEEPSKRERARQAYVALLPAGQPVTGARLAEAAGISASYGRALLADFQADPTLPRPGQRPAARGGGGGAMTATIWRTCPSCFGSFEQPDDPGRKRVYCSRACQQAAYRARQRTRAGQHSGHQDWRSERHEQRRERAGSQPPGGGQRHQQRQERQDRQHQQRRAPPHSADKGRRTGAGSGDGLPRIRRIIAALLRKAAATSFPHEEAACRAKAEALRVKYGLSQRPNRPSRPRLASRRTGGVLIGTSHRPVGAERNGSSQVRPSVLVESSHRPAGAEWTDRHCDALSGTVWVGPGWCRQ